MRRTAQETRAALRAAAKERILVLDGAMGTMIQDLKLGEADFRGEIFKDHGRLGASIRKEMTPPAGCPSAEIMRHSARYAPGDSAGRGITSFEAARMLRLGNIISSPPTR